MTLLQVATILCLTAKISLSTIVKTQDGSVEGFNNVYPEIGNVTIFYGIPFAKPPLGELRFKKPQNPTPWKGLLVAKTKPNSCPQDMTPMFTDKELNEKIAVTTERSEDCLYLNIWTPVKALDKNSTVPYKRDVIVWIHGGAFMKGSSTMDVYDGSYLAILQDVVYVSVNYRLGPFGFLYLGREEAPGNMGLYDMVMALDWIKKNIEAFGGNPDSVTIMGMSAGGASVTALLMSPVSKDKFKNAVVQSGTMFAKWSSKSKEDALKMARSLALEVGCAQKNSSEWISKKQVPLNVIKCLRAVKVKALTDASSKISSIDSLQMGMTPTIDDHFFPESPVEMMEKNQFHKANVLIGHTAKETSIFIYANQLFSSDGLFNSTNIVKTAINFMEPKLTSDEIDLILYAYTDWTESDNVTRNRDSLVDFSGDFQLVCPNIAFASKISALNKVYYYEFQHPTLSKISKKFPSWVGATHGTDTPFFLGTVFNKSFGYNEEDRKLSRIMMKQLANFAHTGNPNANQVDSSWSEFKAMEPRVHTYGSNESKPRVHQCALFNENFPNWILQLSPESPIKSDASIHKVHALLIMGIMFSIFKNTS